MKTKLYGLLSFALIALLLTSCEKKELPRYLVFDHYEFSTTDELGGNWTPVLLTAPDQIAIVPPSDITSAEYLAELAELKSLVSNLSQQQEEAVKYWTNNPILRWNEIALELVAKYNLIPPPNPDGTYTLPSPANPQGPPPFPFSHPPYTSRMLAHLSVAQFDGLISAWHYKQTYSRPAPYIIDPAISHAYPEQGIYSYPSDAAVIASVSREILSAMFPLEKAYLQSRANEHLSSLLWAGEHVQSDLDAGVYLGAEVSKIALARASQDGMSSAQAPKPVSDSIKAAAFDRFGWQWDNLESPVRPVGLVPLYGRVQMWNVPNVELVRSPPPPTPGSAEFEKDAQELRDIAANLTNEQRRIANWWEDGLGSYTPPGHWNRLAKDYCVQYKLNPLRSARVFAYMNMAIQDAGIACWDTKYYYHYPRPIQAIPGFKTILGTPNFPAYTSGHSTFSAAAAEVLSYLFPEEAAYCRAWAEEAAVSRIYGGIHYRFDAEVGISQGKDVAVYTINVAKNDGADD
jgi:hypothetical protein